MLKTPSPSAERTYDVLLINDYASEARLLQMAWALGNAAPSRLTVLQDGGLLLPYLQREGTYRHVSQPDLIVLDQHCPSAGGHTLTALRAAVGIARLPVVVFTGSTTPQSILDGYHEQANGCFCWPVDVEARLALLEQVARHWLSTAWLPSPPSVSTLH